LDVDPWVGRSVSKASRRLAEHGPNQLTEAPREPRWRAVLRQFQDLVFTILLIVAAVSLLVSRE
jgi:Ca2+-transporting ATPase